MSEAGQGWHEAWDWVERCQPMIYPALSIEHLLCAKCWSNKSKTEVPLVCEVCVSEKFLQQEEIHVASATCHMASSVDTPVAEPEGQAPEVYPELKVG